MKDGTIRFGGMGGSVAAAVRDDGMRKVKNLQGVLRLLFSAFVSGKSIRASVSCVD